MKHGDNHKMIRSFCLFSIVYLFISSTPINAQNHPVSEVTQQGLRRPLVLDISARVLEDEQMVVWDESHRKVSIPGSPVGIQLVGSNIVVSVQFTPFIRRQGNVLVAQGQIWIADSDRGVAYYTSIQTIPMELGEPISFFPLGSSQQLSPAIEIVLTINLYNEADAFSGAAVNRTNDR
jgi:hypothetical protein